MTNVILQTDIDAVPAKHGKVRDIYDLGDKLIIVASDRLSAFDVIMKSDIPYKGIILTKVSRFWFDLLADTVETHLISDDVTTFPAPFCDYPDQPGRDQESFDKQFVRNYLEEINFDKSGPGVELPEDIIQKTSAKYIKAYEKLTGNKFEE